MFYLGIFQILYYTFCYASKFNWYNRGRDFAPALLASYRIFKSKLFLANPLLKIGIKKRGRFKRVIYTFISFSSIYHLKTKYVVNQ